MPSPPGKISSRRPRIRKMSHHKLFFWQYDYNQIQNICNKILRMTFSLSSKENVLPPMKEHGLLTIEDIFKHDVAVFMHECRNHSLPPALDRWVCSGGEGGWGRVLPQTNAQNFRGVKVIYVQRTIWGRDDLFLLFTWLWEKNWTSADVIIFFCSSPNFGRKTDNFTTLNCAPPPLSNSWARPCLITFFKPKPLQLQLEENAA